MPVAHALLGSTYFWRRSTCTLAVLGRTCFAYWTFITGTGRKSLSCRLFKRLIQVCANFLNNGVSASSDSVVMA